MLNSIPKNWPFHEAKKLADQLARQNPQKTQIVFETGFGASGLPHIGTFGEVARTIMVMRAFAIIMPDMDRKLICFSDDMDALRKVPENLPNQDMLARYIDMPLSQIPDPFETHESFADHNNARLKDFLDRFGFDYDFISASAAYRSGRFDESLALILSHYDDIQNIMLPSLGEERRKNYAPFFPICPRSGKILMVDIIAHNAKAKTITYIDPESEEEVSISITGGKAKLQWKVDWAMRWMALGVDYEMSGKDLRDSFKLSSAICHRLKKTPPIGLSYELFLDEKGEKISKSRGNGLTMEEWLRYAPVESLTRFLYRAPQSARRLHFDIIPQVVDDYLKEVNQYIANPKNDEIINNPIWYIHTDAQLRKLQAIPFSFVNLLSLVSASGADSQSQLWGFIQKQYDQLSPQSHPFINLLVKHAIAYYQDFILPHKHYRSASPKEYAALQDLKMALQNLKPNGKSSPDGKTRPDAKIIQNLAYDIGNHHQFEPLHDWFSALYQILLGQKSGARFGTFVSLYGLSPTISLIEDRLEDSLKTPQPAPNPALK